jgi:hypothetical protein
MSGDNEIKTILNDPGTSYWLKNALASALDRDLVNAGNDAKLLAMVLERRADEVAAKPVEKNLSEEKEKPAFERFMRQLVEIRAKDITLKFFFDNLRNYAVSASVIWVGLYLLKHGGQVHNFPGAGIFSGSLLVVIGIIFGALNFSQLILSFVELKIPRIRYLALSLALFLVTAELQSVLLNKS